MKTKSLIIAVLLLASLLLAGCATPVQYFTANPSTGQRLVHTQDNNAVVGIQDIQSGIHTEVYLKPTSGNALFNGLAVFLIYVKNIDRAQLSFGAASIRAEDKNGKPVEILSLAEISNRLRANKSKQEWAFIIASSFLSAIQAAPYSRTQQTGTFSGYTSDGRYVNGTTVSTGRNTTVEYLAQQQNNDRIVSFTGEKNDAYARALWNLQRLTLKEAVLKKGEAIEGIIAVRLPSPYSLPSNYRFNLLIDGTAIAHEFLVSKNAK